MARERFDDVEYRIVEQPEPPRPRRPRRGRRWVLGGAVALIVAGGLAAGAPALTSLLSSESKAASGAPVRWHNAPHMHYGAAGIPPTGNG
jgi:hypothetical protein